MTEWISNVNIPSVQLLVACGVPLHRWVLTQSGTAVASWAHGLAVVVGQPGRVPALAESPDVPAFLPVLLTGSEGCRAGSI